MQGNVSEAIEELLRSIIEYVVNPFILLLFGLAGVIFVWGLVVFVRSMDNQEARTTGKKHMVWGLVGMVIMFGVLGIIQILLNTFGIETSQFFIFNR